MFQATNLRVRLLTAAAAVLLLAAGCGGGSVDSGVGSGGTGYVAGTAVAGPVGGATVDAYGISAGQLGAKLGTGTTDANGNFNLAIGSYAGPLMLQVSGGSYVDEATGSTMAMASGDVMTAVLPSVAGGGANTSGIQVTPVTAMAQTLALHQGGGMTDANINAANAAMGNYFSVSDILHVQPMNPLVTGSGTGASQDAQNYGMTLAAMSKAAQSLGLSSSSAMTTALMNDASDGVMDGKMGGTAITMGMGGMGGMMPAAAGTSGMGAAMTAFMGSAQNKSGVTTPTLAAKLSGASGQIMGTGTGTGMGTGNTTLAGTAFNGSMSLVTMTAYAVNGGAQGAQIASAMTDSQGRFSLSLGSYAGPVVVQASGGRYVDEATGTTMSAGTADVMTAALPSVVAGSATTGLWVTPVTAMAQSRAAALSGGLTDANINAANTAMGGYFSVSDILHVQPIDPRVAGSGAAAGQDSRNYGITLAAMSEYAKGQGMGVSSGLVTAMVADASDGVMDGKKGGSGITMAMGGMMGNSAMSATAGTSGLANAMTSFMNSAANASGMTAADMAALIAKLTNTNGHF
jgi:hypothetical protein